METLAAIVLLLVALVFFGISIDASRSHAPHQKKR